MAGMGTTAMVSLSRQGCWAAGSRPAAPRHGVLPSLGAAGRGCSFVCLGSVVQRNPAHSMPVSEGMSTATDWAGSVDRSSSARPRRDLMSSDCASGTCLVCAGAGNGAVVGVLAGAARWWGAAAILTARTAAVVHMRCRLGAVLRRRDVWSRFPCIEARGFIFGPAIALAIGAKFIPLRKPKKLPGEVFSESYVLEYGMDCLEMHVGAIEPGECVVVVDDLVATGGTLSAAIRLLERAGANVVECACLIGLPKFKDFYKLNGKPVYILVESRK